MIAEHASPKHITQCIVYIFINVICTTIIIKPGFTNMVKWRWLTSKGRSGMTEVVQMVKFYLIAIVRKQLYLNSAGVTTFPSVIVFIIRKPEIRGGKLTKKHGD